MEQSLKDGAEWRVKLPASYEQKSDQDHESTTGYGKAVLEDDIEAMRELAIAARERAQNFYSRPLHKYHPKTGKIRSPRECPGSGSGESQPPAWRQPN